MNNSFDSEKIIRYVIGFADLVMINVLFTLVNLPLLLWLGLLTNNILSPSIILPIVLSITLPASLLAVFACTRDALFKKDYYSFKGFFKYFKGGFQKECLAIYLLWYVLLMTIMLNLLPILPWLSLFAGAYFVSALFLLLMLSFALVEVLTFQNTLKQTISNVFLSVLMNWRISFCLLIYLLFVQLFSSKFSAAPFFLFVSLFAFLFLFMYRPKLQERIKDAPKAIGKR